MERTVLSPESTRYAEGKGSMVLTNLAPGYILVTSYGYNDGLTGGISCGEIDRIIASNGWVVVFMDSRDVTGIDGKERDRLGKWVKSHGEKYRMGHVLFRSKIIDLAVALVSLMTGGKVKSYSNVKDFERVIASHVPGFKGLPDLGAAGPRSRTG